MSLGGFDATNVIQSFFHLFATWPWPQAVALVEIDPTEKFQQQQLVQLASTLNLLSWNPDKYPGDSMHVSFFFHLIQADLNSRLHSAHRGVLFGKCYNLTIPFQI